MDIEHVIKSYDGRSAIAYDIVPKIMPLLSKGYILNHEGKLTPAITSKSVSAPWVYTRATGTLPCTLCTEVMFGALNIFPRQCLNCWKVVVRPRTVKELILLLELEDNHTKRPCKCGIELRDHVPALYGGYFYNQSKEQGLECLEDVRGLVSEHISPDIKVTLKRYCTEFELKFGPSSQIEESLLRGYYINDDGSKTPIMKIGEMQIWEQIAMQIFDVKEDKTRQAPFVRQHVICEWFKFAFKHGDMTVKEFFDGESLYTPSETYEAL